MVTFIAQANAPAPQGPQPMGTPLGSGLAMLIFWGLLIGTALLLLGLRGRKINNRPYCRKCRFDLSGAPGLARYANRDEPHTLVCPECGAKLLSDAAIKRGKRQKIWPLIAVGAVFLLAGGIPLAALAVARSANVQLIQYLPESLLIDQLDAPDPVRIDEAATEIERRLANDNLEDYEPAIERILEFQADPAAHWSDALASVLSTAFSKGGLTQEQVVRMVQASYLDELVVRDTVIAGRPFPVLRRSRWSRGIDLPGFYVSKESAEGEKAPSIGGAPLRIGLGGMALVEASGGSGSSWTAVPTDLIPGDTQVIGATKVTLYDQNPYQNDEAEPLGEWLVDFNFPVTVLPEDTPLTDLVATEPDPTAQQALVNGITLTSLSIRTGSTAESQRIQVSMNFTGTPIALAWRIDYRPAMGDSDNEQPWLPVGQGFVELLNEASTHGYSTGGMLTVESRENRYDLRLVADLEAAYNRPDVSTVWTGDPIVFLDVEVGGPTPESPARAVGAVPTTSEPASAD